MVVVSVVGVHGSGKSTVARLLGEAYGFRVCSLEAIEDVAGMDPVSRQLLFFSRFVHEYLRCLRWGGRVVVDSHPLVVVAYTGWWLNGHPLAGVVRESMARLVSLLPPVDLLVLLQPVRVETVLERVRARGRPNAAEEADPLYALYVAEELARLVRRLGSRLARKVLVVPAELEAWERARIVYEAVSGLAVNG